MVERFKQQHLRIDPWHAAGMGARKDLGKGAAR
jgi:hypothetical protein